MHNFDDEEDAFADSLEECPMTIDEIRASIQIVKDAKKNFEAVARRELLKLRDNRAWKKLGYKSWRQFGKDEFGCERRYLSYLVNAASVERDLGFPIPERHARPLALLQTAEERREAYRLAKELSALKTYKGRAKRYEGVTTTADVQSVVDAMRTRTLPKRTTLKHDQVPKITVDRSTGALKIHVHVGNSLYVNYWSLEELADQGIIVNIEEKPK